jgi:hypothetical protein
MAASMDPKPDTAAGQRGLAPEKESADNFRKVTRRLDPRQDAAAIQMGIASTLTIGPVLFASFAVPRR